MCVPCVPELLPRNRGVVWTLAKLEQGDEVWPHLQLLLSPLCLPVVPEAFKAPAPIEHCPLPVPAQGNTQTSLGLQDWSGRVPRASSKPCPAAEGLLFAGSRAIGCSLAVRRRGVTVNGMGPSSFSRCSRSSPHQKWTAQVRAGRSCEMTSLTGGKLVP